MRMNQPSVAVWILSLLLAFISLVTKLGLANNLGVFAILVPWSFWLMALACGLLLLSTLLKRL